MAVCGSWCAVDVVRAVQITGFSAVTLLNIVANLMWRTMSSRGYTETGHFTFNCGVHHIERRAL